MNTEFFQLQPVSRVLELLKQFPPVGQEVVPLLAAPDRVLAQDILAPAPVPEFDRATMDGYAVRAADTFGAGAANPAWLTVAGEIAMGQEVTQPLAPGTAMRIATGGMLPPEADAVVMVEYTQKLPDGSIEIYRAVAPGENIIRRGEDVAAGALVLPAGHRLRPQDVGLLAAVGVSTVPVFHRPRVAVIATGDEIVPVDAPLPVGKVRDANSYAVAAQVQAMGGEPWLLGIVPDDFAALHQVLAQALAGADLVLLSGGSSVGTRDLAVAVLESFPEAALLVHGVAISPGKPTILARIGGKPVLGLPGHPVSAMIVMEVLGRPLLARLCGLTAPLPRWGRTVEAKLSRNLAASPGREAYIRVRLRPEDGVVWAEPILGASGLISTMVKAEGYIRISPQLEGLERGAVVTVFLF